MLKLGMILTTCALCIYVLWYMRSFSASKKSLLFQELIAGMSPLYLGHFLMFIIIKILSLVSFIPRHDFFCGTKHSPASLVLQMSKFSVITLSQWWLSLMRKPHYHESWVYGGLLYTYRVHNKKVVIFQ